MSRIFRAFQENKDALRRVFKRHFKSPDDVDDLLNETFLKCFAAEIKTEIREPRAFIFRVAKNLAVSESKKKFTKQVIFFEDSEDPDVLKDRRGVSADACLDGKRKLAVLSKAIANLPDTHREVFIMRKVEKLKFKQIAIRLDVSVSTVEKRVAAAFVMCSAFLRAEGYSMSEFGVAEQKSAVTSMEAENKPLKQNE